MATNGLQKDDRRQFERLLQQQKVGNIAARLHLWEVFLALPGQHVTVHQLYQELRRQGWSWGVELVMDTLELLVSFGLAAKSYLDGLTPLYEPHYLGEHHDHLCCLGCGGITEFYSDKLEELQQNIIREQGFHPLAHKLVVHGICRNCLSAREQAIPLTHFGRGETVVVEHVGGQLVGQLNDLGIVAGAKLHILSQNKGNMVVALNSSRLALSSEWCQQIMVRRSLDKESAN